MPNHPVIGPLMQMFPELDRDSRHYLAVIGPRIAEAMIMALDLPRRPDSRNEEAMTIGVAYDPSGPRDIQRFMPVFCGIYSIHRPRVQMSEQWRRILEEHDRYDELARTRQGAFGAALVQVIVLPPSGTTPPPSPESQRVSLMTSFMTIRLSMQHASIPGDSEYDTYISRWLYYLKLTGDLTPST